MTQVTQFERCAMFKYPVVLVGLVAASASAAPVDIQVRGADGQPVVDAVVTIQTPHSAGPIRFAWPYVMGQKNISFQPHVLIVPVGANVAFPNFDTVRHHVYSFSKAKKFELKLYGHDESRSIVFDKPGVVSVGCNIHDAMSGYVVVVDTPYAAKTDVSGNAHIDAPAGAAKLEVWSSQIRAPDNRISQPVTVAAKGLTKSVAIGS